MMSQVRKRGERNDARPKGLDSGKVAETATSGSAVSPVGAEDNKH